MFQKQSDCFFFQFGTSGWFVATNHQLLKQYNCFLEKKQKTMFLSLLKMINNPTYNICLSFVRCCVLKE